LANCKGKHRSDIKRMEKRLQEAGASVTLYTEAVDLDKAVADYQAVYEKSWKQAEPHPGFVPGMIRLCAAKNWLRLGVIRIGDQPIAAQVWRVGKRKAEIYKVAYDEAFKAYSPGTVLTARLMRHVLDVDRVDEVDYLVGDDAYKKNWMTHRRERIGIVAYELRSLGGLAGAMVEMTSRAAKPWVDRWRAARTPAPQSRPQD
jgi:hypothetical protein